MNKRLGIVIGLVIVGLVLYLILRGKPTIIPEGATPESLGYYWNPAQELWIGPPPIGGHWDEDLQLWVDVHRSPSYTRQQVPQWDICLPGS